MIVLLWSLAHLPLTNSQINCSKAPDNGTQNICNQIQQWESGVKRLPMKFFSGRDFVDGIMTIFDCMDPQCICSFLVNSGFSCGQAGSVQGWGKSVRKEYRQMTDKDRRRYHAAMWGIKANGDYLLLSSIHADMQQSPGAHSGPSFLPWHREYIKRVEIALRRVDPLLSGLPYWDSVLDYRIPNPKDSVLWSNELMGSPNSDGFVTSGAFANWTINNGSRVFKRELGEGYSLFSDYDLAQISNLTSIVNFLAYTSPGMNCSTPTPWDAPEFEHGKPHSWVGGDMFLTRTSTYDPIFYLHHSFLDFIWETWRVSRQNRMNRQVDYPPDDPNCTSFVHFSRSQMQPFTKLNSDGLSNQYTDNLIQFAPRPSCVTNSADCQSKYLFCDFSHGTPQCASKVVVGGNCTGFINNEDVCYNGICVNGVCQGTLATSVIPSSTITSVPAFTVTTVVPSVSSNSSSSNCYNNNFCCDYWNSINQCTTNPGYMTINCMVSCRVCTPNYDQTIACSNRAPDCVTRLTKTDCNDPWMAENCRQFCGWCGFTRQQQCTSGFTGQPTNRISITTNAFTAAPIKLSVIKNPTCLNNHMCCLAWARLGYCTSPDYATFMDTFCAPSCGQCGSLTAHALWKNVDRCVDFLNDCSERAIDGGCEKHDVFMKENCKSTCRACALLNEKTRFKECQLDRGAAFDRLFGLVM